MRLPSWCIPALYALVSVVVALILPRMERAFLPHLDSGLSAGASLAIFSSVGSGMISLTGIVFSLTFLMVQFSATAYSPRLVMWLAREPVLWHAVGIFSATFLYSITAIAQVDRSGTGQTPLLSSWLVIVLLLASVGMFIALIEKISLLQIHRMLSFTADYGRRVIEQTYLSLESSPSMAGTEEYAGLPVTQVVAHVGRPQSLQALNVPVLLALSSAADGTVVVTSSVGDTLVEGTMLLRIHGGRN